VKKEQLESFNAEWEKRDATYRCALGALERAGIPAVFVSYERLMAQPVRCRRLDRMKREREREELVGAHTGGGNALAFKQPT
jgi:hypothetical protein